MDNEAYHENEELETRSRRVSDTKEEPTGDRHQLKRQLGLPSGIAMIVGTMIGSGIFISPGGLLRSTGSVGMSLIVWLLCGLVSICGALCYVELGCMCTASGAEYSYLLAAFGPLNRVLGPLPAFLYQWSSIIILKPSMVSIIMLAFSQYLLQPLFDDCGPPRFMILMVTCGAIALVTAINCWSTRFGALTQNIFTVAKVAACLVVIGGGAYKLGQGNTQYLASGFQGTNTNPSALALAFYNGLWAYDGWNNLNYCTEELRDPFRNLPRAIVASIPFVTIVYLLMNVAYFTVLSPEVLVSSPAVAVSWADLVMPSVAAVVPVAVALSTFGAANGCLFSSGRLCLAAAREGHCPTVMAMLHRKWGTPLPALLFMSIISLVLIFPANIGQLIDYFSFTVWLFYGLTFLALLVMRWTRRREERKFSVPIPIPILMFLLSVYLVVAPIIQTPRLEFLYAFLFVMSGVLVYIPLVWLKLRVPGFHRVTTFLQLYLNVVPCEEADML